VSEDIKHFPDPKTPIKDFEYYRKAAECFWDWHNKGRGAFPQDYINKLKENRLYATGNQGVDRYLSYYTSAEGQDEIQRTQREWIDSGTSKEAAREGWANMDVENIPVIAPKIMSAIHGQFTDVDWCISAKSMDHRSGAERDKQKWLSYIRTKHDEWYQRVSAMGGIEIDEPKYTPDSIAELHLLDAAQGFKLPYEVELEKVIAHSFDISNWEEIRSEILTDIVVDNRFVVKLETCKKSGKRIARHIRLEEYASGYSRFYDHHDVEMAGTWEDITVGELSRHFERSSLEGIARQHVGMYGNPNKFDDYEGTDSMGLFKYDFFKVRVFHFSFIDYDNDYKASYKTPYGRTIDRPVRYDYEPKERETKIETSIRKLKKVSWIINTKYVYNYGEDNDMVRPDEKDVMLPYVHIKLPGKSITESAKVYYDDLVHIHYKTMNAMITAAAAGFAIDAGALEGVTLNGSKVDEMTLFDLYRHKGILIFKRKDQWNQPTTQGIPIQELPGGIGRFLDEQIQLFQHTMNMLETITGINPVTLGGQPEERAAVRNVQMSVQGTDNILRPISRGIKNLKKRASINFALSIPYLIQNYPKSREAYEQVIGKPGIELLEMIKDDIYDMGITLEPMLTIAHQESLMRKVEMAMQKDQQGMAGLSIDQAMLIEERIMLGAPLKLVRLEVANALKKAQRELDTQRERMLQIQGEQQQAAEQQKHQQELEKLDVDVQAKMDLDTHQMHNRAKEEYLKSNLALIEQLMDESDDVESKTIPDA